MALDVAGPLVTTGIPVVGGLASSVRLTGTDAGGGADERLAGEGSVGGEEPVAEGAGIDRLPGRSDGKAGFSETRFVCALREVSFGGEMSVAEGNGTEDGISVIRGTEDKDVLSAGEPVWMPREVSVNGGKSVAMGSLLVWGAFTVAVAVCAAREASVDSDTSVDPGTTVCGLPDCWVSFGIDESVCVRIEGTADWDKSVAKGTEIGGCERAIEDVKLKVSDGFSAFASDCEAGLGLMDGDISTADVGGMGGATRSVVEADA